MMLRRTPELLAAVFIVFMALRPAHAETLDQACARSYLQNGPAGLKEYDECLKNSSPLPPERQTQRWAVDGRKCYASRIFGTAVDIKNSEYVEDNEIYPEDISDIERVIHNLKIYDRFWTCVAQRDGVEPPPKGGTTTQALL